MDFNDKEFDGVIDKARLVTYEPGAIILKQGNPGKSFYVIATGDVEVGTKTGNEDPLSTPPNYIGTIVNILSENNFFGERSLITGEPRSASVRALDKTRCFVFNQTNIPSTSVLSGRKKATDQRIAQINDKYGVDMSTILDIEQTSVFDNAKSSSQSRGSANQPGPIVGVDTEEELDETDAAPSLSDAVITNEDIIIPLLIRFKQARQVAQCFDYIVKTKPKWGDAGEVKRRSMLISKLPPLQVEEFRAVFNIIDTSNDNRISLVEMKGFMESIGEEKTVSELKDIMNKSHPSVDTSTDMTFDEFMGVMAEAEFYYLFTETFNALDKHNSGFVRAKDLDRVLCGMRDLVFNDRFSIIDVEDTEMLIDYEQFSKMLLGVN